MIPAKENRAPNESRPAVSDEAVRLAAKLRAAFGQGSHVIQFAGIGPREGVTMVAGQVASALAQTESRPILLLDANLRSPGLHTDFRTPSIPGLSDLILGRAALQEATQRTAVPGLALVPTGTAGEDVLSLFASPAWSSLLQEIREKFRFAIVNSPPLLSFAESALLAPQADGVVLVIGAGQRRRPELIEAKRLLDGLKVKLVGVVLSERGSRPRETHSNGLGA